MVGSLPLINSLQPATEKKILASLDWRIRSPNIKDNSRIDLSGISQEGLKTLFRACKEYGHWWYDILDCRWSMRRQKLDVGFEEGLGIMEGRGFKIFPIAIYKTGGYNSDCLEVGFHTFSDPADYFLWINVALEYASEIEALIQKLKEENAN
jgi:hypothetical protein